MYILDINKLSPNYRDIKNILFASLKTEVIVVSCRADNYHDGTETIFACKKAEKDGYLNGFLTLYNRYVHFIEDWAIDKTTDSDIDNIIEREIIPALRGFNFNVREDCDALENPYFYIGDASAWLNFKVTGKIIISGRSQEIADYGISFLKMIGKIRSVSPLTYGFSYWLKFYETGEYYVLNYRTAGD